MEFRLKIWNENAEDGLMDAAYVASVLTELSALYKEATSHNLILKNISEGSVDIVARYSNDVEQARFYDVLKYETLVDVGNAANNVNLNSKHKKRFLELLQSKNAGIIIGFSGEPIGSLAESQKMIISDTNIAEYLALVDARQQENEQHSFRYCIIHGVIEAIEGNKNYLTINGKKINSNPTLFDLIHERRITKGDNMILLCLESTSGRKIYNGIKPLELKSKKEEIALGAVSLKVYFDENKLSDGRVFYEAIAYLDNSNPSAFGDTRADALAKLIQILYSKAERGRILTVNKFTDDSVQEMNDIISLIGQINVY